MATDELRAVAFMYLGQWVARCPIGCGNTEKRGTCDDGTTGGLDAGRFTCRESHGGCGLRCGVDWPADIGDLERTLLVRPRVFRNWQPGETVLDLVKENAAHGLILDAALEGIASGGSGIALEIVDGQIIHGQLTFSEAPREVEGR